MSGSPWLPAIVAASSCATGLLTAAAAMLTIDDDRAPAVAAIAFAATAALVSVVVVDRIARASRSGAGPGRTGTLAICALVAVFSFQLAFALEGDHGTHGAVERTAPAQGHQHVAH